MKDRRSELSMSTSWQQLSALLIRVATEQCTRLDGGRAEGRSEHGSSGAVLGKLLLRQMVHALSHTWTQALDVYMWV